MRNLFAFVLLLLLSSFVFADKDAWYAVRDPFAAVKKKKEEPKKCKCKDCDCGKDCKCKDKDCKCDKCKDKLKWFYVEDADDPNDQALFSGNKQIGYFCAKTKVYRPYDGKKWGKACKPPVEPMKKVSFAPLSPVICTT